MNNEPDKSTYSKQDRALAQTALAARQGSDPDQCPRPEALACLVDGTSDTAEKEKLFRHLANCRQCYTQWLTLSQVVQKTSRSTLIAGPWKKIITIGSPILALAASVAIFINIFGPSFTVMPLLEEKSALPRTSTETKSIELEILDIIKEEAPPQPPKSLTKPTKKERAQQKSSSASEQKAPLAQPAPLLGKMAPAPPHSQTFAYSCTDDFAFVARIEGESAWLFLPEKTEHVSKVQSPSGTHYANDAIIFWSKDEQAVLDIAGSTRYQCRLVTRSKNTPPTLPASQETP